MGPKSRCCYFEIKQPDSILRSKTNISFWVKFQHGHCSCCWCLKTLNRATCNWVTHHPLLLTWLQYWQNASKWQYMWEIENWKVCLSTVGSLWSPLSFVFLTFIAVIYFTLLWFFRNLISSIWNKESAWFYVYVPRFIMLFFTFFRLCVNLYSVICRG